SVGAVYNAIEIHTGAGVALKLENASHPTRPAILPYEGAIYAQLQGVQGIARVHWSGREQNANILVMNRLGPDLERLYRFCHGSFSLKTVLMLGEQMLASIEEIHSRGIIVRDIKPENYALGQIEDYKVLFLFEFGLAKLFLNPTTGKHIAFREGRAGLSTPRFASHNVHFGLEPSRRDDVEGIGILLLYLLHGELPWQGICAPSISAKLLQIGEMKRGQHFTQLLQRSPKFFTPFFQHCRSLEFESKPDYVYLQQLLRDAMAEHGWEYDWEYDWWNPGEQGSTLIPEEYKIDMRFVTPVKHRQLGL
ncbi:kinase-like domain-containing protein, partial [Abortiporus biennis]